MIARTYLLGAVAALVFAAGCQDANDADKNAKGRLLGVSFQTMNNPFFVDLNEGLKKVVEANGDRLMTVDAQFNSLKQKNDISDLVHQGAKAIFINPVNWEGIRGSLIQAKRKGIPVIIVDAPAKDMDLVLCTVASDNVKAGRLAAQALAKVRPQAKIAILHLSVNKACIDRVAGFKAELTNHNGMKILAIQEGKGTTEGGRPAMRDLIGQFPQLDAAFPVNDPSALGAVSALESKRKLNDVAIVTVDGSRQGVEAVKAGKILSTSAQFPKEIGRIAAEKVYQHFSGKPIREKNVMVEVELITKENADSFLSGK